MLVVVLRIPSGPSYELVGSVFSFQVVDNDAILLSLSFGVDVFDFRLRGNVKVPLR